MSIEALTEIDALEEDASAGMESVREESIATLRDRYDYIVIDSPPVLLVTDASILAAICDLTILVVRQDKTGGQAMANSLERLAAFDANVLGVVFNGAKRKPRRQSHYYRRNGIVKNGIDPAPLAALSLK